MRRSASLCALGGMALAVACTTRSTAGTSTQGAGNSAASASTGTVAGGSSSRSGGGQGTGRATSGSSSGTTTGPTTGPTRSPYFDGGYVFCAEQLGNGGLGRWMCQPGTYFCDPGDRGICFQCRGDSDCADTSLPTYDPRRPRCDLDSGVAGYQGFCQQCLADSDCSFAGASHCDLDPSFPTGSLQPSIETLGFETCELLETDCRQLDGPLCRQFDESCNTTNGRCEAPGACASDQDCLGRFSVPYLPEPFCVGGTCESCDGGACIYGERCSSDADCGNPDGGPGGLRCDAESSTCGCTDSSPCGGYFPICMGFDAGGIGFDGTPLGFCGCDDSVQCGDAGLICIPPTFYEATYTFDVGAIAAARNFGGRGRQGNFCGVPCTEAATFPACRTLPFFDNSTGTVAYDACDPNSGLCEYCTVSSTCQDSFGAGGPLCDTILSGGKVGLCFCLLDSDCPYGALCLQGACVPSLPRCSPSSCGMNFCNPETGLCSAPTDPTIPRCLDDYDCGYDAGRCQGGKCFACLDNRDCIDRGPVENAMCCHDDPACSARGFVESSCAPFCHSDLDCVGSLAGPSCEIDAGPFIGGTFYRCGCATDADCATSQNGLRCVTDPAWPELGRCACQSNAECPAGDYCALGPAAGDGGDPNGGCDYLCGASSTVECPDGFSCGPGNECRSRCDEGQTCDFSEPVCDQTNAVGNNGSWGGVGGVGDAGGAIWCYQCRDSRDCSGRLGCSHNLCQSCADAGDCAVGTACAPDGLCHATCDQGLCDGGQVCDVNDRASLGNVCFDCASSGDCPNGEGCDSLTHTCGTCEGPTSAGGPYDCPPDAICSSYWTHGSGVCLQNCDRVSCPASAPTCAVFPSLTPDHSYCFGCREDDDCADGGWCDQAVYRTFSCQDGPR